MESKTIIIDPAHLQLTNASRTRKRSSNASSSSVNLRPRQPKVRERSRTSKHNSLLKFIRRHQDKNRERLFQDDIHRDAVRSVDEDESNVEDTLDYLMHIANKVKHGDTSPVITNENVSIEFPSGPTTSHGSYTSYNEPYRGDPYRGDTYQADLYHGVEPINQIERNNNRITEPDNYIEDDIVEDHQDPHIVEYEDEDNGQKIVLKYQKQKKIKHRTYKVGKSKHLRKIGVLVSNKTIRKGITTKAQLLKQTPIHEIRQYLIKHGLIKVGTTAPNEVLRKMYETAQLICGELHNHNTDILLHNFMNP